MLIVRVLNRPVACDQIRRLDLTTGPRRVNTSSAGHTEQLLSAKDAVRGGRKKDGNRLGPVIKLLDLPAAERSLKVRMSSQIGSGSLYRCSNRGVFPLGRCRGELLVSNCCFNKFFKFRLHRDRGIGDHL